MGQDAGRGGAIVFTLPGEILKRHQQHGAARLPDKQIERAGQLALPEIRVNAEVPVARRHGQNRLAEFEAGVHFLLQAARFRGVESECGIGRDPDLGGRHADSFQYRLGLPVADRNGMGAFRNEPGELDAAPGIERPHAHGVEHHGLAVQRGQDGRPGVISHAPMAAGEERIRVHAPIVVEQAAAADHHQVGRLHRAVDGGHIVPGHCFHTVGGDGLSGIAGGHHHAQVRPSCSKLRQGGGQNGFVAGIAEAVVTDKKDHLFGETLQCKPHHAAALCSGGKRMLTRLVGRTPYATLKLPFSGSPRRSRAIFYDERFRERHWRQRSTAAGSP